MASLLSPRFSFRQVLLLISGAVALVGLPVARGADTLVGTLPGEFSVDNKGAANYTIPLQIPPGRGGLQPSLALSYNSNAGNGPLGVGFSLSTGFPQAITRGRSILARDGVVRGVNFDADDKFYLDGKRLICVSGTYGQPGSTYRTEVDSFVTITATGTGSLIDGFTVSDKSGRTMHFGKYGTTTDGYHTMGGEADGKAYSWALKRVEDTLGNYCAVSYTAFGNGEYEIERIDYTGGTGVESAARVEFAYEARSDTVQAFMSGRFWDTGHRLKTINATARSGATYSAAASYELAYENAPDYGRSRLMTVTPSLANSVGEVLSDCAPITMAWNNDVRAVATQTTSFAPPTPQSLGLQLGQAIDEAVVFGDFNGDGRDDYVYWDAAAENGGLKAVLSDGTNWGAATLWMSTASLSASIPNIPSGGGRSGSGLHMHPGDVNGDGKKDLIIYDGSFTYLYAVVSTGTAFVGMNGGSSPTNIGNINALFSDPAGSGTNNLLISIEGSGASSRIAVADFTGDGRDDVVVTAFDAYLYLFESTGAGFTARGQSSPQTGAAGYTSIVRDWNHQIVGTQYKPAPNVRVMPTDLNGDGRMDYVVLQIIRDIGSSEYPSTVSYVVYRTLKAFMAKPDFTFSDPVTIWSPLVFPIDPSAGITRDEVALGVLPGDFNGDGLGDFLCLNYLPGGGGGVAWNLYASAGSDSSGNPSFSAYSFVMPKTVTINGESVLTYCNVITNASWNSYLSKADKFLVTGSTAPTTPASVIKALHSLESGTLFNTFTTDINGDGLSDLVWYVGLTASETTATSSSGWWAMLSRGKFVGGTPTAVGSGFSGPVAVPSSFISGSPGAFLSSGRTYFNAKSFEFGSDFDGNGHSDILPRVLLCGEVMSLGQIGLARGADLTSRAPFGDTVKHISDGLGRAVDIEYSAAKDSAIYTPGSAVTYPIRELRASTPVVADVYKDSGGSASDRAHFGYQYSGNRLDLSGRGSLGFHSFVTVDHQTNLFKYQFLTQSFPMTGLTAREQTYRYWTSGTGTSTSAEFRLISSHDNTVVFDEVVDGADTSSAYGTVYPFISQAVESRWEDADSAHYTLTPSTPSSQSETLFPADRPDGAHITIVAQSWFDEQNLDGSPQTTLPGNYRPSDTDASYGQPDNDPPLSSLSVVGGTSLDLGATVTLRTSITDGDDGWIGRNLYWKKPGDAEWTGWSVDSVTGDGSASELNREWQKVLDVAGLWQFMLKGYDNRGLNDGARWGNESVVSIKVGDDDSLGLMATATIPAGTNKVTGYANFGDFESLSFPRKITYGNLRQLKTNFGDGFKETVVTTYHTPSGALTGLVDTVTTKVESPGYGEETAPVKSYTYKTGTPLVRTEKVNAADDTLDSTTTYERDGLGRITDTKIDGYDDANDPRHIGAYTVSSATEFDEVFDLPKKSLDAYSHETTTTYHPFFGTPTSVIDANGAEVKTTYDALGRVKTAQDVLKSLQTETTYAWTTSEATDWVKTQTVSCPDGVTGLDLSSVYAVRSATTAQPTVTTYYDRLGRAIRTIKEGFGTQEVLIDTVYNTLGQVVAVSLPYKSGDTAQWTITTYDVLGRVKTVKAPNGTVTTNDYHGRTTQVSVDASDREEQINTTLVDAKGRTIRVWNADNSPGTLSLITGGSTTPSIEFKLDGFGRMRETLLKDQTQTIKASYDALGRQTSLNDPDKGEWLYVNNALGQVVKQTDARSNVTLTTFDRLGRQLSRVTTEPSSGPVETARWYYFDAAGSSAPQTVEVSATNGGWIGALQRETLTTAGNPGFGDYTVEKSYTYDSKGRPHIQLHHIDDAPGAATGHWFYAVNGYDDYSRPTTKDYFWRPPAAENPIGTDPIWRGYRIETAYDAKSYVTGVTSPTDGRTWWQIGTDGYDPLDRPVLFRKGNGHWTKRTYRESDGVLTGVVTGTLSGSDVTGVVQNLSFDYDGLGNLTSRTGPGGTESFTYDSLNRLKTTREGTITYFDNGNIKNKGAVGGLTSEDYTYDSVRPHAVKTAFGYTMGYDLNGNLTSRTKPGESWNLKYAGFDKPRWMAKTSGGVTSGSEFLYDANRSRAVQLEFDAMSAGLPSHYTRKRLYVHGAAMEVNYTNEAASGSPTWTVNNLRIYLPGPDGVLGTQEFDLRGGMVNKGLVYHTDHLGSIESITEYGSTTGYASDGAGKGGRFNEDAWGQRRDPLDWSGPPVSTDNGGADSLTPRGFTGHEMLDDLGLVHMNGRIYDPLLGRFLSADVVVEDASFLQTYNRYSYVRNNPLRYVDPDGKAAKDVVAGVGDSVITNATVSALAASENANIEAAGWNHLIAGVQRLFGFNEAAAESENIAGMYHENVELVRGAMQQVPEQAQALMSQVTGSTDVNHSHRETARTVSDVVTVVAGVVAPVAPAALNRTQTAAPKPAPANGEVSPEPANAALVPGSCFVAGTEIATDNGPRAIETLKVGDRVLTTDGDASSTEVDPLTWRKITLRMPNPECPPDIIDFEILRSGEWIRSVGCEPGATIALELDEIGLSGPAVVERVEPCPPIQSGIGRVVVSTLTHFNSFVVELRLDGEAQPLEVTDRHRLFSATRNDWVAVGELKPGEELATQSGVVRIESVTVKPGTHRVYNLEVEFDHCYFAGRLAILSHNGCPIIGNAQKTSAGHAESGQARAEQMSESGEYSSVHLARSIRTVTEGAVEDDRIPDVSGVRLDGRVDVIEHPSKSQTLQSQKDKVESMQQSLGERAGPNSRAEPIFVQPPHADEKKPGT